MENETEVLDTQNNQDGESETTTTEETETLSPQEIADLKHKADVSSQNFERAKKAEAEKKALETELAKHKSQSQGSGLTAEDVLAFNGEGISHREDVELAQKFAKNNGVNVRDILDDEDFKTVLSLKREQRETANATQTKGGAKGVGKVTGEELLRKAAKGEFPESDEDINKMLNAKFEAKKQRK
jgi:hypothetical protein